MSWGTPTNRSSRANAAVAAVLTGAILAFFLAVSLVPNARAAMPRSYYRDALIYVDQQNTPEIHFAFVLDSVWDGNNSQIYYSKTIDITVNVTREVQLSDALDGVWTMHDENVSGRADYTFDLFGVISESTQGLIRANPGVTVQSTVNVHAEYTDYLGRQARSVYRSLTFTLNYAPPGKIEFAGAAIAGLGGAGVVGLVLYVGRRARLEELFLMHKGGALIRHWTHAEGPMENGDIVSGMLIVLQEFVRDSFDDRETNLERLRFGKQQVILVRGQHTILAAVVRGRYMNGLPWRLTQAVREFEGSYANVLPTWDGNVDVFVRADLVAKRFLRPRRGGAAA